MTPYEAALLFMSMPSNKGHHRSGAAADEWTVDCGNGPKPLRDIPTLGRFDTDWRFEWDRESERVLVTVSTEVPEIEHRVAIDYAVPFDIEPEDGLSYSQVRITPTGDSTAGSAALRAIGLAELHEQVESEFNSAEMRLWLPFLPSTFVRRPRPGRRGRPDIEYALFARDYVAACEHHPDSPNRHLAEIHHISVATVRNRLYSARNRDLLTTPTQRGKAGGKLTPRALRLLRDWDAAQ